MEKIDHSIESQLCLELNRALFERDADRILASFCQLMKRHKLKASPALVQQIPLRNEAGPKAETGVRSASRPGAEPA